MASTSVHTGAALAAVPLDRGWSVRAARDEDAEGLVALVGGVFAEYPGCVLDPDDLDADLFAWASHLAGSDGAGWVVTARDGDVVACVGVVPVDEATVELKRLYVAAAARRRGLGAALVALVEAWARDHGRHRVALWSDTRFDDAHRLYGRLGYERADRTRQLHDPSDTVEAHFTRVLA
jgi:putative acetyltransferase